MKIQRYAMVLMLVSLLCLSTILTSGFMTTRYVSEKNSMSEISFLTNN